MQKKIIKKILNLNLKSKKLKRLIEGLKESIEMVKELPDDETFLMSSLDGCVIGKLMCNKGDHLSTNNFDYFMVKLFGFCDVYSAQSHQFSKLNYNNKLIARLFVAGSIGDRVTKKEWLKLAVDTLNKLEVQLA